MSEILLLCEYATLNGGEMSMLATLGGVRAAGFTPVVMMPARGPLAGVLSASDVQVLPFDCRMDDGSRVSQSRLREELAMVLRRRRPALLHANSLAMARLSGPVAKHLTLPSLGHLRDIVRLSTQAVVDVNCHRRLLAVSEATRAYHVSAGLAAEKVCVLYNGVDLDEFCPRPPTGYLQRELGLPPETQLVGVIGQISLRKGQDVLLRAAQRIADQLPNVHYVIVGERHSNKDESRRFENNLHEIADVNLTGRVHFLGVRHDVCRLLNELTLLVHSARQEPLGRVLLEASAAGVPTIATNVGGTAEIFPPEKDAARLVPPDNADALGEAILELLGDPALRCRLAPAARRRAETDFDVRHSVEGLLRHYSATLRFCRKSPLPPGED
jgi:glycosyltransferase involved in cell wall biosynthesis